jgi:ubiquinone/menaquinone biosynthesis C-methylase UbiE
MGGERGLVDNVASYFEQECVDAYAELNDHGLIWRETQATQRYFTRSDAAVLDIGCGTGRTTGPLSEMGFDVVGVDLSEPMTREARSLVADATFVTGDATELGFRDETFDYALFSFNGIDLLYPEDERHAALSEIHRVLNPGGIFIFSARNAWAYPVPSRDERSPWPWLRAMLEVGRDFLRRQVTSYYDHNAYVGTWTRNWEEYGVSYFICPPLQRRQLKNHDFEVLDVLGGYFANHLHYVARKPVK